jgi:predicted amidohydrolase
VNGGVDGGGNDSGDLFAFGPDGTRLAAYRKIHLFDAQGFGGRGPSSRATSIDPAVFVRRSAVRPHDLVDLRFPELARSLADAGAQVLLVCSS